jgi:hypothetical protein
LALARHHSIFWDTTILERDKIITELLNRVKKTKVHD